MVVVEDLSPLERDELIARLRRSGWTIRAIAKHVGISPNGVHYALKRMDEGKTGQGRDRRT